jgi:hypothetical protein
MNLAPDFVTDTLTDDAIASLLALYKRIPAGPDKDRMRQVISWLCYLDRQVQDAHPTG